MDKPTEKKDNSAAAPVSTTVPTTAPQAARAPQGNFRSDNRGMGRDSQSRQKNYRRTGRDARVKPEFDQKIINVRRVARVSAGGRRFNFSVAMILGNRRGSVGVGTGKGVDTAIAIDKAMRDAKRNMIKIAMTKTMSIAHSVEAKYSSARILIIPAPGRGVVAGSAVRYIIEFAGIKDVTAKILSPSKNHLNAARAAVKALSMLKPRAMETSKETKA